MMDYAARAAASRPYRSSCASTRRSTATRSRCAKRTSGLAVFTWNDYRTASRFRVAHGRARLGRGDVIGIIGDNRPDWVAAEIATMRSAGMSSASIAMCWMRKRPISSITGGQAGLRRGREQVDKLLTLADRVPHLKHIRLFRSARMRKYDDPRLMEASKLATMDAGAPPRAGSTTSLSMRRRATIARSSARPQARPRTRSLRCSPPAACCVIARPISPSIRGSGTTNTSRAAAALDHGTGLCTGQRPALPDEGQLRRRGRTP